MIEAATRTKHASEQINVRLTPEQRGAVEKARLKTGQSLVQFIESALAAEVGREGELFPRDARRLNRQAA